MAEPQAAARVDEQRFRRATGRRFVGLSGGATATPTGTSTRSENAAQTQQRGQAEGEEYSFVQLADTQFGMMAQSKSMQWYLQLRQLVYLATCGRNDGKALIPVPEMRAALKDADDEALLELEIELARKAVKIINRLQPKPRFAVVCGDLTNAFPDKKPAQQDKEVAVFKQIFSQLDPEIELVCVCGNHDVGQKPTPETIERYKDRFGDDYFSFRVGPDRFVVLNSQLYVDSSQCREAAEAQDMWLDTELFDKKPQTVRHSIAFSHVPPFVWQPDEHHAGFNMPQAARMKLLSRLAQAGFSHIFCGHYHRNAGGIFQRKHLGPIEVVTTAAIGGNIGTDPEADELAFEGMKSIDVSDRLSGMRIVHVGPNGVRHEFRTLRELRDEYREARDAWTSNEDATILKMREAGGKWEDIASALTNQQQGAGSERARSASLVKHRYRKLAAQAS